MVLTFPAATSNAPRQTHHIKRPGVITKRFQHTISRYSDTVIFEETGEKAEFDRLFHGLPSNPGEQEATWEFQPATVQNLICDQEYTFWSWKEHVYAYSETKARIISRFGDFPTFSSDGAKCPLGLVLGGDWLLVHWGSLLMMCDRRNFAEHPFRVVWQYPVSATITRISLVAEHLVLPVPVFLVNSRTLIGRGTAQMFSPSRLNSAIDSF